MFVRIKQQARVAVSLFSWMNMNIGYQPHISSFHTDLACTCDCLGEGHLDLVEPICNGNIFNDVTGMNYI